MSEPFMPAKLHLILTVSALLLFLAVNAFHPKRGMRTGAETRSCKMVKGRLDCVTYLLESRMQVDGISYRIN